MSHSRDDVAAALASNHGLRATVVQIRTAAGCDNEIFRATARCDEQHRDWPQSVVVRVARRSGMSDATEVIRQVHAWCTNNEFPVLTVLASGSLHDGARYILLPYVAELSLAAHLSRPWALHHRLSRFADLQLRLHALDARDWPGARRGVDDVLEEILASAESVRLAMASPMVEWLVQHRREALVDTADVVCHFDFHPFNVLWHRGGDAFVIDWDTAALGSPAADVGITSELMTLGAAFARPKAVGTAGGLLGKQLAEVYLRRYRRENPVDLRAVRFWRVVHCMHVVLWKRGAKLLGTTVRNQDIANWTEQDDAQIHRRFLALTI